MTSLTAFIAALAVLAPLAAPSAPPRGPASLVLVVASNRGTQAGRAPLRYADDDGAKYHAVFSALTAPGDTVLLSDFDRDTARLFPALAAEVRAPTRTNVELVARGLARRVAALRAEGRTARFYFVYAGHGDVDAGRGFLELADGRFSADDLAATLREVGAAEAHVVLDSCNAFYVVNPRRPGGRRIPTPADAADALSRRLPGVGVFLSTSAQAEVFEWSELQSGVFSHAVRSGLLGGADADLDGQVTYDELAGFVAIATADVRNPLYRPHVFARGPDGDASRAFVDLPAGPRAALAVSEPQPVRLAARDAEGLRWADAYKEEGGALRLWFPPALGREIEVQRLAPGGDRAVEASFLVPDAAVEPVELAALAPSASPVAPRGTGEIFRALFTRPFGPRALAAWREERARAPELDLPSPSRFAELRTTYVAVRGGVYLPQARPDLAPGPDVALAVGREFYAALSGEVELSGLRTSTSTWRLPYPGDPYLNRNIAEARVAYDLVPLTLSARLELPSGRVRPFIRAGVGVALATVTFDPPEAGLATLRTTQAVGTAHAGAGLLLELNRRLFASVEARYASATVREWDARFGMAGLRAGVSVGWRFPPRGP
jgi:hypothetical protein